MNTGLKSTESREKKNIPNIKIESNSNSKTIKIIPTKISSSKDTDKNSLTRGNNEMQAKKRFYVTTDFSIKDNEKKNANLGKKRKSNNNSKSIKFIITTYSSNKNKENVEKQKIKNYPFFITKIGSSKLNIYNYIIFYYSQKKYG